MIRDHEVEIPLFLYIALHNTHAPVESPPEYCGLYDHNQSKQNMYYGQVTFVDHTVANITEMLRGSRTSRTSSRSSPTPRTTTRAFVSARDTT